MNIPVSNQTLARDLVFMGRSAALATLEAQGNPYCSYVVTAPAADGAPLMLLSTLAVHTHNLQRDPRASLLFTREPAAGEEKMTTVRLTLTGTATASTSPELRQAYLDRHPDAARYAQFADFAVYRFETQGAHLVAGFGRIVNLSPDAFLVTNS